MLRLRRDEGEFHLIKGIIPNDSMFTTGFRCFGSNTRATYLKEDLQFLWNNCSWKETGCSMSKVWTHTHQTVALERCASGIETSTQFWLSLLWWGAALSCQNTLLRMWKTSSPSLQNKDPGGGVGSTSRGWRLVGLGVETGRFRCM